MTKLDILNKIQDCRQRIASLELAIRDEIKAAFSLGAKDLFTEYPDLEDFCWQQYTPYFNDGEPCVFRAEINDISMTVAGETENYYHSSWEWDTRDVTSLSPTERVGEAIVEFLKFFTDEDLKFMFGDHASVLVTREGVQVEGYDHE